MQIYENIFLEIVLLGILSFLYLFTYCTLLVYSDRVRYLIKILVNKVLWFATILLLLPVFYRLMHQVLDSLAPNFECFLLDLIRDS